jgi:hypothetical protein
MPAAKQPQDHLPKNAPAKRAAAKTSPAKAEAEHRPIVIDYEGNRYTIDPDNANNLELLEFAEDGSYISAIRGYLGVDQWAKWKDSVRTGDGRVPADGFEDFLNAVMAAIGGAKDDHPNS